MDNRIDSIDSSKLPEQDQSLMAPTLNHNNAIPQNNTGLVKPQVSKRISGKIPEMPPNQVMINKQVRPFSGDEPISSMANPSSPSIELLARGMKLLSIANLRQLLRIYSLPTGGNKKSLVDRLILYLETLGPNQQSMVMQFSVNLKKLLSSDDNTATIEPEQDQNPTGTDNQPIQPPKPISDVSPSILYELTADPCPFGPQDIQSGEIPTNMLEFVLTNPPADCTAILEFIPTFRTAPLRSITVQVSNKPQVTLHQGALWISLSDLLKQNGSFRIITVDPQMSITALIRWVKRVPISDVMQIIIDNEEPPCEVDETVLPRYPINGICPATRKIIKYPVRGVNCVHKDCFDLSGYLSIGCETNQWICPICAKSVYPDELRIDSQYIFSVSNSILGK